MAHTFSELAARTSSTGNPISVSLTVAAGATVVVVCLNVAGGTDRAGGSLTWNSYTFTQASTTQKSGTAPEGSAELWYLLNPLPGTANLVIPNTGALTIRYAIASGVAVGGGASFLRGVNGAGATSANPSPGSIAYAAGDIGFAVVTSGATTWAPTPQAGTGWGGTGTSLGNFDDGALGGGFQYHLPGAAGSTALGWTQASDDWGAVAAYFGEQEAHRFNTHMGFAAGNNISVTEKVL